MKFYLVAGEFVLVQTNGCEHVQILKRLRVNKLEQILLQIDEHQIGETSKLLWVEKFEFNIGKPEAFQLDEAEKESRIDTVQRIVWQRYIV